MGLGFMGLGFRGYEFVGLGWFRVSESRLSSVGGRVLGFSLLPPKEP